MSIAESAPRTNQYIETVRRSYATLIHMAHVLAGVEASEELPVHIRQVSQTVASLVDRLVWADRRLADGEYAAIEGLIAEDEAHGATLKELLPMTCKSDDDLRPLPMFLLACTHYDRNHGTRLTGSAINALESLGLALLASDREISPEEISTLQAIIGAWREGGIALVRG